MDTIELILTIPSSEQGRFLAFLEDQATGFVQRDTELRAYVPADRWAAVDHERLKARLAADGYPGAVSARPLASKNWNALWEESLSPVRAGPFLICPTSADIPTDCGHATVLRIDPEMSFGTGHHATTRLALELLGETLTSNDRVLDVGTGTGVLAIAACRAGAAEAVGVDTNPDAVRNARENIHTNGVGDCVTVLEGSIDEAPSPHYDLVVANITRRVLLDLLPDFVSRLAPDGRLVMSGLLQPHRSSVLNATQSHDLTLHTEASEDGWWAAQFSQT